VRAFGCCSRVGWPIPNQFRRAAGRIWLDDVNCLGTENFIGDCHHGGWGRHNCRHYEDVAIACLNASESGMVNLHVHLNHTLYNFVYWRVCMQFSMWCNTSCHFFSVEIVCNTQLKLFNCDCRFCWCVQNLMCISVVATFLIFSATASLCASHSSYVNRLTSDVGNCLGYTNTLTLPTSQMILWRCGIKKIYAKKRHWF